MDNQIQKTFSFKNLLSYMENDLWYCHDENVMEWAPEREYVVNNHQVLKQSLKFPSMVTHHHSQVYLDDMIRWKNNVSFMMKTTYRRKFSSEWKISQRERRKWLCSDSFFINLWNIIVDDNDQVVCARKIRKVLDFYDCEWSIGYRTWHIYIKIRDRIGERMFSCYSLHELSYMRENMSNINVMFFVMTDIKTEDNYFIKICKLKWLFGINAPLSFVCWHWISWLNVKSVCPCCRFKRHETERQNQKKARRHATLNYMRSPTYFATQFSYDLVMGHRRKGDR